MARWHAVRWVGMVGLWLGLCAGALAQGTRESQAVVPPESARPTKIDRAGKASGRLGEGPVLFAAEGLRPLVSPDGLRAALSDALGRDLVSVAHPEASRAVASLWIAAEGDAVTIRMIAPDRVELWQTLRRGDLARDATASIVAAVLNMVWQHRAAQHGRSEIVDPFCPPGMICARAPRPQPLASPSEREVLDPWDTTYRRFADADLLTYAYGYPSSRALSSPRPRAQPRVGEDSSPPRPQRFALDGVVGVGVNSRGAMLRYEVRALRRFPHVDLGLSFLGARGQPEPWHEARRAVSMLIQGRFLAQGLEIDLGGGIGTFIASHAEGRPDVLPYLRGLLAIALPVGRFFDVVVQADVATMFAQVAETKAFEQGVALGLRHRM